MNFTTKCFLYVILFLLNTSVANNRLTLHFFGSPGCGECLTIKQSILFPAREAHPDIIDLHIHDVDSDSGFSLLMNMEKHYGVSTSTAIELFLPDTFLTGSKDILKSTLYRTGLFTDYSSDDKATGPAFYRMDISCILQYPFCGPTHHSHDSGLSGYEMGSTGKSNSETYGSS